MGNTTSMEYAESKAKQLRREMETLEEKLRAKVVPGHALYISKQAAADWLQRLMADADGIIATLNATH